MRNFLKTMMLLAFVLAFSASAFAVEIRADQDDGSLVVIGGYDLTPSPDEPINYLKIRAGFGAGSYGLLTENVSVDLDGDDAADANENLVDVLNDLITHKFSGAYSDLTGKPSLFSGVYSDLSGKPTLFSGDYADLTGKPSTFTPSTHTHVANDISDATTVGKAVLTASSSSAARAAIGAGVSSFSGAYVDLSGIPSTFTPASHTHVIGDVTGLTSALAGKQDTITAGSVISDAATNATTSASADAVTILGISVPTNASYAALVADYNDLAAKQNSLATKFNTLLSHLEAQGIQTP